MTAPYILHGLNPSPYSVKMRASLRYRRLPFVWDAVGNPRDVAVAAGLPPVIPVLRFPDDRFMNDSTPLAHALEREHPGQRSIIPDDPAHACLNDLLNASRTAAPRPSATPDDQGFHAGVSAPSGSVSGFVAAAPCVAPDG